LRLATQTRNTPGRAAPLRARFDAQLMFAGAVTFLLTDGK
jgi:hypothetical protein